MSYDFLAGSKGRPALQCQHYNKCVRTANTEDSGYHETLTIFWIEIIGRFLEEMDGAGGDLDNWFAPGTGPLGGSG